MSKARRKVKVKKKPKVFDLEWVAEPFCDHESFFKKRMFGGLSLYVHNKMVMCLVENPGDREYRGKTYDSDIWNGVMLPTEREHHKSLIDRFPSLSPHVVLPKWLYLPLAAADFESSINEIAEMIRENSELLGIYPSEKKRAKKVKKKEKVRCQWCGENPLYVEYHDKEWGVPVYDDQKLFEFMTLESAQAGLSWITILQKRENYRKAFAQFDPVKVARFNERKVQSLLKNSGIVRNELKIRAAINNAKVFLEIQKEFGSFAKYMWSFVGGKPIQNKWKSMSEVPAKTKESDAFSKDLKKRGFKFVGSTTMYAHMQACGMVNDHLVSCFRYKEIKKIKPRKRF